MASLSAFLLLVYVRCSACAGKIRPLAATTAMTRVDIVNLHDEIETWAKDLYEKLNQKDLEKSLGMKLPFHDLRMAVDTTNFFIETEEPNYEDKLDTNLGGEFTRNNVLFKTSYSNVTDSHLEYALNTQRTTSTVCSLALTKGFVFSKNAGLKVSLPNNVLEMNAGMSRELNMEDSKEKTVESEMTWSLDTTVKVPPKKTVLVQLVIKEFQYSGSFSVTTRFHGSIGVALYKGDSKICFLRCNELRNIFKEKSGFAVEPETKKLCFQSCGRCQTRCGVEQFIKITESDNVASDST